GRKRDGATSGRRHALSHYRRGGGSHAHPGTAAQRPECHGARARGPRRDVGFSAYRRHQRTEWSWYHRGGWTVHQNEFRLDGTIHTALQHLTGLNYPSPDALQEFKILTSGAQAEYGRHGGGVFIAVTRSGTNQFHGALW